MSRISDLDSAHTPAHSRPRYYKLVRVGELAAILLAAILTVGRFTGSPIRGQHRVCPGRRLHPGGKVHGHHGQDAHISAREPRLHRR